MNPAATEPTPPTAPATNLLSLLARPDEQRLREYKYRFSQAVVFGLPVVFLQLYGRDLGGPESARWIGVLQALLSGWVVYVAAAGMAFEGILLLTHRRFAADLVPSLVGSAAYLYSLVSVLHIFVTGDLWYEPLVFHVSVTVLAGWTGIQWFRWHRRFAHRDRHI